MILDLKNKEKIMDEIKYILGNHFDEYYIDCLETSSQQIYAIIEREVDHQVTIELQAHINSLHKA